MGVRVKNNRKWTELIDFLSLHLRTCSGVWNSIKKDVGLRKGMEKIVTRRRRVSSTLRVLLYFRNFFPFISFLWKVSCIFFFSLSDNDQIFKWIWIHKKVVWPQNEEGERDMRDWIHILYDSILKIHSLKKMTDEVKRVKEITPLAMLRSGIVQI